MSKIYLLNDFELSHDREVTEHCVIYTGTHKIDKQKYFITRLKESNIQQVTFILHQLHDQDFFLPYASEHQQNKHIYVIHSFHRVTLASLIQRSHPFEEAEIMTVLRGLLEMSQSLAKLNLCHQDLSVSNVFLEEEGNFSRLLLFDISKINIRDRVQLLQDMESDSDSNSGESTSFLFRTGVVIMVIYLSTSLPYI